MFAGVVLSTPLVKFIFWTYLLYLVAVFGTVTNPADPDLWHRLAFGEYAARTGHFPAGDTFSYLADYQQVADHEWGSALIFYSLWHDIGPEAIVATKLITLAVTLALVIRAGIGNRRPTTPMAGFYALILLTLLPSFQSTVRCMVFTHILFALWILWYQRERQGHPVLTAWYVVTMAIWANLHGGFVVGLLWLVLVGVVELLCGGEWKIWVRRFGLCSLATLINPYGWGLWLSTGRALVAPRQGFGEWAPVAWIGPPNLYLGFKLLFPCILVALAIQFYRKGWSGIDRRGVILLSAFTILGLTSARHTSILAVVAGALLPGIFPLKWPYAMDLGPVRRLGTVAVNSALIMVPFLSSLMVPSAGLQLEYPSGVATPVGAVDFLTRENVRGKLLVPFNYGSYALWELRGKMRVSMDGRYDLVYTPQTYRRVEDFFVANQDWHDLLVHPPPNAVLVPRSADVYLKLRADPAWREAYRDPYDAVFLPR